MRRPNKLRGNRLPGRGRQQSFRLVRLMPRRPAVKSAKIIPDFSMICSTCLADRFCRPHSEPGNQAGKPEKKIMRFAGRGVERKHRIPPAGAHADVAHRNPSQNGNHEGQQPRAHPAQPQFRLVVAQDAGPAHVGGKSRPVAGFDHRLAGIVVRLEKAFGPVLLIQPQRPGVAAHNPLAEDAARQLPKMLLLQRKQMALGDLGHCRDVFQRNAAGEPLLAQFFTKISHRRPTIAIRVDASSKRYIPRGAALARASPPKFRRDPAPGFAAKRAINPSDFKTTINRRAAEVKGFPGSCPGFRQPK